MPADDLVLNVRQIGNYPPTGLSFPGDLVVIQRGGLGGPYQSITTQALVATALAQGGGPLDVSTGFAPADAVPMQIFTDNLVVALGATHNWNCYFSSATNSFAYTTNGVAAAFGYAAGGGFVWGAAPPGSPGAPCPITDFMTLSPTGELTLYANSLTLPRDPMLPMEAATAQWVSANTVASFNGRTGAVALGTWDILSAGGAPIWSPQFGGAPCAPTPEPASSSTRIATTAYVQTAINEFLSGFLASEVFVASFNGRTGVVVLTAADVTAVANGIYAPLDSPNFTGYATSLTPPPGTNDGQLATTAFVQAAVSGGTAGVASFNGRTGIVALTAADLTGAGGALIASPAFTGTPAAPTAAPGTNTTQLATTAFVNAATGGGNFAPLNSPAFTGVPTGPTAALGTNTTQLATTAFVMNEINAVNAGVISFNGRTGAITLLANDISAAGGATLASPIFTGLPSAPTANPGTNTTQLATTQFVTAAIAALPAVPLPSTTNPIVNGPATPGTSAAFSRGDHVHPIDTSRAAASALASYLPLIGGTLTGALNGTAINLSAGLSTNNVVVTQGTISIAKGAATNPALFFNDGSTNRTTLYFNVASGQTTLVDNYSGGNLTMGPDGTTTLVGGGVSVQLASAGNLLVTAAAPGNILELVQGAPLWGSGGPWLAISDARIKTVTGDYALGLNEVLQLRPVNYTFKGNEKLSAASPSQRADGVSHVGLVAQEVESVFPAMVEKRAGFIDDEPVNDLRTLNTGELIFALVNAVKQLAARVATLEAVAA